MRHPAVEVKQAQARLFTQRTSALERFGAWDRHRPSALAPAAALEAIGTIDDMLPEASRRRSVDTTGVVRMHSLMRRWSTPG